MANKVLGFTIQIQGTDTAINTAEELRRAISEVQKELKKASDTKSIEELEKKLVDLKARQAEVNEEIREQVKARRQELQAVDAVDGTYSKLSKQLNEARRRYKDLAAAEQESSEEAQRLLGEITLLDRRLKFIDASVGQFQRNVGGYTEALSQFFPKLSGSIGQIGGALDFAQGAVGGFNKALGFIAVAVTVFQEISAALDSSIETAKEFNEVQKQIAATQQLTQAALEEGSGTIIAISRTYQEESRDILNAANTLTKEFGIGLPEALTLIEAGFRKGANAQGDFLDQLREYPAQFAAAGGSAEQFLDILIRAQEEGIYSDKGIDAVKEFGLRIREQTKATRDALTNAFGEKFTTDLFKGINNGSITTVQALQRVGKGLQDTGLTAEQTQKVIADTFGGPGEDAGLRFLQLLGDIDDDLNNVTASTNAYQSQQEKLFISNQELAQSQAALSKELVNAGNELTILKNNFQTFINNQARALVRFFDELPQSIAGAQAFFKSLGSTLLNISSYGILGDISNPLKAARLASIEARRQVRKDNEKAQAEDEKAKKEAADRATKTEAGLQQKLTELRQKRAQAIIGSAEFKTLDTEIRKIEQSLRAAVPGAGRAGREVGEKFIAGSVSAIQQRKQQLEKAIAGAVTGSEAQRKLIGELSKIEKELEDAVATQNRIRLEGARAADVQRLADIQQLGSLILTTQVSLEQQVTDKVFEEVKKRNALRKGELEKEKETVQQRKVQRLQDIENYTDAAFQLISAFASRRAELEQREFEERIAKTNANIESLQQRAQQASGIRQRLLQQQVAAQQAVLAKQQAEAEAAQKKRAKQEKALAIIQSIISGALAVNRALFTGGIPLAIATGIFAAVQTATIAAQPLATGGVVGISGRRVTDRQNMPTRSNGDNVLATVKRGEVVLNQRQQAALGGARTFRSIGVPGFRDGGPVGAPITAPRIPQAADLTGAIQALDRKTDAINARLDRLRAFVVTEDIARDMQAGKDIQIKASL